MKDSPLNEITAYLKKVFKRDVLTKVTLDDKIIGGIIVKKNGFRKKLKD